MELEKKVLVIIPAYNEEGSVRKVIEDVRTHLSQADILIVNDGSTDVLFFQRKQPLVLRLPLSLEPNVTDHTWSGRYPFHPEMIRNRHRTPGWMLERRGNDLLPDLRKSLFGEFFWNWRVVRKPFDSSFLEGPLVLVGRTSRNAVVSAGLRNIPESFSQLEKCQSLLCYLFLGSHFFLIGRFFVVETLYPKRELTAICPPPTCSERS
jgi:hypothetical protein